jgi:hypothetical protein
MLPRKGKFGLIDYEKMFCPDPKADDIFDLRGVIRETGCMVVVRPDQYVAHVLPSTRLRRPGRLLRRCADRRRVRESPVFPDRGLGDREADPEPSVRHPAGVANQGWFLVWEHPHASNRLRTVTIAKLDGPHPDRRMPSSRRINGQVG